MFEDLNAYQLTFWFCALFGTGFFLINTFLSFFSGIDSGLDIPSHETVHEGVGSPDAAFQLLSLTSLTGFLMMFGWVGLAAFEQYQLSYPLSLACALVAGTATMYLTASIFAGAKKLASDGSAFDINQTLGKRATVYSRIPEHGKGQIQIAISNLTHEVDALSENSVIIESNTNVEVVKIIDQSTVVVKPLI
jgi:hypothetical protein